MPSWRINLPPQGDNVRLLTVEPVLRSENEIGPPKVRRRSNLNQQFVTFSQVYSNQQVLEFEDFWENDLSGGTAPFDWEGIFDDATIQYRFAEKPTFVMMRSGDTHERFWSTEIRLEVYLGP